MARTVITKQQLSTKAGVVPLPFIPVDVANGMQVRNTGVEVVALVTGTASSVTLTFPSVPDAFGRTGDQVIVQGANLTGYYGPFSPANIWGDGAANLYINPSLLSGTASIAVIAI